MIKPVLCVCLWVWGKLQPKRTVWRQQKVKRQSLALSHTSSKQCVTSRAKMSEQMNFFYSCFFVSVKNLVNDVRKVVGHSAAKKNKKNRQFKTGRQSKYTHTQNQRIRMCKATLQIQQKRGTQKRKFAQKCAIWQKGQRDFTFFAQQMTGKQQQQLASFINEKVPS